MQERGGDQFVIYLLCLCKRQLTWQKHTEEETGSKKLETTTATKITQIKEQMA